MSIAALVKTRVSGLFTRQNDRSQKVVRNIVLSFGAKGGNILIGLILVPMLINYITPVQYGIWLTVSSIVAWMNFFDIGMGNGLRNKLANAVAMDQYDEARKYVSTTYAVLAIVSVSVFLVFSFINRFIDWNSLLNIPASLEVDLSVIIMIVLASFCLQFVIQTVGIVLTATHQPAKIAVVTFFSQLLILFIVFFIKRFFAPDLKLLVIFLTGVPIVVMLAASVYFYRGRLAPFMPSFKNIDFSCAKPLLTLGGTFFLIQMGALVLFQTDNIIITRLLGPESVTNFNIAFKLFSIITMGFTIIVTPFWSAFTDAYAKNDFAWIRKSVKWIRTTCLAFSLAAVVLWQLAPWIYKAWVGDAITIAPSLTFSMMLYTIVFMWQTGHVFLLNGIGKIKLQLLLVVLSALLNIPLAVVLGKMFGVAGITIASTTLFVVMGIIFYMQTEKIINRNASGIWNK